MMKKFLFVAVLGIVSVAGSAQNLLLGNKVKDNWSIGLNFGGVTPLKHSAFFPNIRPTMGLELNKQLTPVVGFGLEGLWSVNTGASRTAFDNSNVSLLSKFNLNNLFGSYLGAPRPFEVEAVAGFGWLHGYVNGNGDQNDLSSKLGLNFNFNLGQEKAWTLAVKPALVYNLQGDKPEHGVRFNANNAAVEITAGLIYHFKNSNGKHYMTLGKAYDQVEVDGLNSKVNDLRSELQDQQNQSQTAQQAANQKINELQNALNACRSQKPTVVTNTNATMESYVSFRQGKATVDTAQLPNVERIATYLKNHSNATVVIKGYASPEGGAEINTKIANQRAEAVKDLLVSKYKIASTRISAEGQGVGNMFSEPDWNRVSICTLENSK
jgi:Outer membrane protein and related peptidoglycan-associated (lipo)proteins